MLFLLVSLSVMGLFLGALLPAIGRMRADAESALSGLALGMLPALVLARLLPHTFESLGAWSLVFAAAGFGLVTLSHQAGERAEVRLGSALVLPALLLHAVGDGATLAMSSSGRVGSAGGLLAAAAILHRVPEGLFVASSRKSTDLCGALSAALPLALATLAGALSGQRLFEVLPDSALDAVLALGAGAMLRMLSHTHDHGQAPRTTVHAFAALGFLAGLIVVLAVPGPHDILQSAQPRELSIAASLLPLFIESAPAILVGLALAASLRAWPGREPVERGFSALRGLLVGVRQPQANALTAATRGLGAGAAPAFVVACIVAGLSLGLESAALSFRLLGGALSVTRLAGAAVLASIAALAAASCTRQQRQAPVDLDVEVHVHDHGTPPKAPHPHWFAALTTLLDQHGAALCFGLLASAALEAALAPNWLARLGSPWDLLLAAAAAIVCQMSALAATPLAAILLHKGASVGAGLTFLWLTPLLQPALLTWIGRRLGLQAALAFGFSATLTALALGFAANPFLSTQTVPEVHPLIAHAHAPWEIACALVLGCLILMSLLRLGPRGFAAGLRNSPPAQPAHAHPHGGTHHAF